MLVLTFFTVFLIGSNSQFLNVQAVRGIEGVEEDSNSGSYTTRQENGLKKQFGRLKSQMEI
jgi:hypothetical protein